VDKQIKKGSRGQIREQGFLDLRYQVNGCFIVAPYNGQVSDLSKRIPNARVGTAGTPDPRDEPFAQAIADKEDVQRRSVFESPSTSQTYGSTWRVLQPADC
jgi:hypothetical protein